MIFKVHMTAFCPGQVRMVSVDDARISEVAGMEKFTELINSIVFLEGQNDVNRDPLHVSVSCGDIIEWPESMSEWIENPPASMALAEGSFWNVTTTGFRRISGQELVRALSSDQPRIMDVIFRDRESRADLMVGFSSSEKLVILEYVAGREVEHEEFSPIRRKAVSILGDRTAEPPADDGTGDLFDGLESDPE